MSEQIETKEIDWKSLIPPKFLYINNDPKKREKIEKKYGKSYDQLDPINDKIDDSDLIIMLGGLKHLLKLRKYKSVKYTIKESAPDYASVGCSILFKGNPDIKGEEEDIEYSDNACAHPNNTTNFAQQYLVEMATNRALCRTIKSFLNLNIVSKEELGATTEESKPIVSNVKQIKLLSDLMTKKKITWKHIVDKLKQDDTTKLAQLKESGQEDKFTPKWNEDYTGIEDLPNDILFDLIDRLKRLELPK